MTININVKRKFKVNGKEYNSIEEMPDNIRETFDKAMASRRDPGHQMDPAATRIKIIFNGTEYDGLEAMPPAVRQLYEKVLRAAETGEALPESDLAELSSRKRRTPGPLDTEHPEDNPRRVKFESSFSPRTLILSAVLAGLLLLFYILWKR